MSFSLLSYAKINWTLRVLGKRDDGYHELCTVFQTVSLHDTLTFEESDRLELTCDDPQIPVDDSNLIIKAALALQEMIPSTRGRGAKIHLEKRIPSPGGLGGGSSNATVALIGLRRLWDLDPRIDLRGFADELGSDTSFFLHGGTAIGMGRGEQIEPITDKSEQNLLIITPRIDIATKDVFARLNAPTLTNNELEHNLSVCRTEAASIVDGRSELRNDLESTVFAMHPEVERVKQTLLKLGAVSAAMSGSGASVFAVFDNRETRQTALDALDIERDWRKFAVATVSRDEYREALRC
ncbi:MAG: 4-(cytidine 5'-diphospho)-2-C-methyl-D-erythritol kinase [Blastocatellia bacterium]|nr:4-(cytidine 5'-diphospho)-2-C-methyl-D-erythritol kinase [Blastocatellia bacterium]